MSQELEEWMGKGTNSSMLQEAARDIKLRYLQLRARQAITNATSALEGISRNRWSKKLNGGTDRPRETSNRSKGVGKTFPLKD